MENFLSLIAEGKAPASVLGVIRGLDLGIEAKEVELGRLTMSQPSELDQRRIKKQLWEQAGRFDELIRSDVLIAFSPVEQTGPQRGQPRISF